MKRPPKDIIESARTISRRALVMGGVQLGVIGALGWRLVLLGLRVGFLVLHFGVLVQPEGGHIDI